MPSLRRRETVSINSAVTRQVRSMERTASGRLAGGIGATMVNALYESYILGILTNCPVPPDPNR